jgi:hypothetical protein
LTVSWQGAPTSTEVSLFYCPNQTCPYVNSSGLFGGRSAWHEYYGESGGVGSISDFWDDQNPIPFTHFLLAGSNFGFSLQVTVTVLYHNPGPGTSWLEFSGLLWPESIVATVGVAVIVVALVYRVKR